MAELAVNVNEWVSGLYLSNAENMDALHKSLRFIKSIVQRHVDDQVQEGATTDHAFRLTEHAVEELEQLLDDASYIIANIFISEQSNPTNSHVQVDFDRLQLVIADMINDMNDMLAILQLAGVGFNQKNTQTKRADRLMITELYALGTSAYTNLSRLAEDVDLMEGLYVTASLSSIRVACDPKFC